MKRHHLWPPLFAIFALAGCQGGPPATDELRDRQQLDAWAGESGDQPFDFPDTPEGVLERTSRVSPPDDYEFVGYVRVPGLPYIHDAQPFDSTREALLAFGLRPGDPDQGLIDPPIDSAEHDVGRSLALSVDGRLFVESEESFRRRLESIRFAPESGASFLPHENGPPNYDGDLDPSESENSGLRDGIHGPDSRRFVGNSEDFPHRAVGVQVLKFDGGEYFYDADLSRRGSGTMISPRALATNAHVFLDGHGDVLPAVAAPGAKSRLFSNADVPPHSMQSDPKWPFGGRRVQWYHWPLGYDGSGAKFDYGVLVLYDLPWSPGFIRVGHQSTSWLDYRAFNMSGYPDYTRNCADSPYESGKCEGAQYRVHGDVRSVFPYKAYTWLDTEPGQSGSGIYFKRGNDRVLYLINVGNCNDPIDCGIAKRLRAGSRNTICNWMESWPSDHFSNPSC